jgi:uncharacterized protein YndB with AHSA1/START domain
VVPFWTVRPDIWKILIYNSLAHLATRDIFNHIVKYRWRKIVFNIIVFAIAASAAGLLAYVASRPDTFRIERNLGLRMPPEKIFPYISDLHNWALWSPFEGRDPSMTRKYSGAQSGKGSVYDWDGNKNVGSGRMEVTDTTPFSKIIIKLDFLKPFEAHNTVEFTLVPKGDTTNVSWCMYGTKNYFAKMMHCCMDMDKMIGTDFQNGLATLKAVAEKEQAASYG